MGRVLLPFCPNRKCRKNSDWLEVDNSKWRKLSNVYTGSNYETRFPVKRISYFQSLFYFSFLRFSYFPVSSVLLRSSRFNCIFSTVLLLLFISSSFVNFFFLSVLYKFGCYSFHFSFYFLLTQRYTSILFSRVCFFFLLFFLIFCKSLNIALLFLFLQFRFDSFSFSSNLNRC